MGPREAKTVHAILGCPSHGRLCIRPGQLWSQGQLCRSPYDIWRYIWYVLPPLTQVSLEEPSEMFGADSPQSLLVALLRSCIST